MDFKKFILEYQKKNNLNDSQVNLLSDFFNTYSKIKLTISNSNKNSNNFISINDQLVKNYIENELNNPLTNNSDNESSNNSDNESSNNSDNESSNNSDNESSNNYTICSDESYSSDSSASSESSENDNIEQKILLQIYTIINTCKKKILSLNIDENIKIKSKKYFKKIQNLCL